MYGYVGDRPLVLIDSLGMSSNECICGPDVTDFLHDLLISAYEWRHFLSLSNAVTYKKSLNWFRTNGVNFDWLSSGGPYKTDNCPKGNDCKNTYWLCGECVHDHWIGNFMYSLLSKFLGIPDTIVNMAGQAYQLASAKHEFDPPWDKAGYAIARNIASLRDLCGELKKDPKLWIEANDLSVTGWMLPSPHAKNYTGCKKCQEDLPPHIRYTFPGGKLGESWPKY